MAERAVPWMIMDTIIEPGDASGKQSFDVKGVKCNGSFSSAASPFQYLDIDF